MIQVVDYENKLIETIENYNDEFKNKIHQK